MKIYCDKILKIKDKITVQSMDIPCSMSVLQEILLKHVKDRDLALLIFTELAADLDAYIQSEDYMKLMLKPLLSEDAEVLCWQIHQDLLEASILLKDPDELDWIEDESEEDEEDLSDILGNNECEMCERQMPLTFHHLFPKKIHKRLQERKTQSGESKGIPKAELRKSGIMICRPCHSMLHRSYDHATLAERLNSLERILEDERIQEWVQWASKQRSYNPKHAKLGLKYKR